MIPNSKRNLLFAALAGALLSYGASYVFGTDLSQQNIAMENKIKTLEALLTKTEEDSKSTPVFSLHQNGSNNFPAANKMAEVTKQVKENGCTPTATNSVPNSIQALRNLEISPANDYRSFAEKAKDLLSGNPTREEIAIVSKGLFDKASDQVGLSDYALQSMYNSQTNPDLRRVIAQVLAQRGNDTLLNDQIAQAEAGLKSTQPGDRQNALNQLAKTRNIKAVDAIVPLLHDPDINVRLDALQALRNTGNEQNFGVVEMMRNDPNPAISSLATEVASDLKDLSSSAHTTVSTSDIEAGLPQM